MLALGLIATSISFFFTVFYILGGLPLHLRLKYDVPNDSRFVRGFFNVHSLGLALAAAAAAGFYASAGQQGVAIVMGAIALAIFVLRQVVIVRMDRLRPIVVEGDPAAIVSFRKLHVGGMLVYTVALCGLVWSTTQISM